jgi:hypothetical protein
MHGATHIKISSRRRYQLKSNQNKMFYLTNMMASMEGSPFEGYTKTGGR